MCPALPYSTNFCLFRSHIIDISTFLKKGRFLFFVLSLPVTVIEAVSFANFASAFQFTQKFQLTIEKSIKI